MLVSENKLTYFNMCMELLYLSYNQWTEHNDKSISYA
jgi:hypothetical protein